MECLTLKNRLCRASGMLLLGCSSSDVGIWYTACIQDAILSLSCRHAASVLLSMLDPACLVDSPPKATPLRFMRP